MTQVHSDKYENFGGKFAAFDPLANLRVGVKVLQDCIRLAGSIEGGLKSYVGAANNEDDGGYAAKVMVEFAKLQQVAKGRQVPMFSAPANPAAAATNALTAPGAPERPPASDDKGATVAMK